MSQITDAVVERIKSRHEKGTCVRDLQNPYELHSVLPDFVLDFVVQRGGQTYPVIAEEQEMERTCGAYSSLLKEYVFALEDRLAYSLRHERNVEEAYVAAHVQNQRLSAANAELERRQAGLDERERRCRQLVHENQELLEDNASYKAHLETLRRDMEELLRLSLIHI